MCELRLFGAVRPCWECSCDLSEIYGKDSGGDCSRLYDFSDCTRVDRDQVRDFRNWADLDLISPGPVDVEMRALLDIDTPHVALYSGNLANKQGIEIPPAVARLLSHRDDITMLICGDGPISGTLQEKKP